MVLEAVRAPTETELAASRLSTLLLPDVNTGIVMASTRDPSDIESARCRRMQILLAAISAELPE